MSQRKREINFNKQDSRTLLQVLEDQKLMEAMKQSRLALEGRASFAPFALDDADELGTAKEGLTKMTTNVELVEARGSCLLVFWLL